ncbi:MAG: hypothetical protein E7266_00570 [Lachnospiraceae bacterium]|nr:hypothetical protein [Lachnospiraceae bacterium]
MENRSKINTLMKTLIYLMLAIYLVIYVVPLGVYDRNECQGIYEEDETFTEDMAAVIGMMGVSCLFLMVILHTVKYSDIPVYTRSSLALGIVHFVSIRNGFRQFKKVPWFTPNYDGKFPANLGSILLGIITVINVIFLVVSVIRLIDYIKNKKKYNSENEFIRVSGETIPHKSVVLRDKVESITYWLIAIFTVALVVMGIFGFSLKSIAGAIGGYAAPVIGFYILFLKNWINNGKWVKVIASYLVSIYVVYILMFYTMPEALFGIWVYILDLRWDFMQLFICIYAVISIVLLLITILIGVIGFKDRKCIKESTSC